MNQIIEILSRNKKTAIIALFAAMLIAIVILAMKAFSNPKEDET